MTPKERAVAALNLQVPDMVPTFELEFQLEEEMFGKSFRSDDLKFESLAKMSQIDREKRIYKFAEDMVEVYTALEYSIIPAPYILLDGHWDDFYYKARIPENLKLGFKYLRELVGDKVMIGCHGDGTFAIPDGNEMYDFVYEIADDPDGVKQRANNLAISAAERNKKLADAGVDCLLLCSDYCYNSGPFVSPAMFGEYIQPYLYHIIDSARKDGLYTIKHTDGNIMPILEQIVECKPHAIHSIDPMAGVDIKEVKRMVGDKVCLCGNVHCAALQTGTDEEVIESAEYCLTYAKPNGGYIFATSNIPFKGMDPARYTLILDVWKRMRDYK